MKHLIALAFLLAFSGNAEDGVYLRQAAEAQVKMEGQDAVVRMPMVKTAAPKAKCILLADSAGDSELIRTPEGSSPLGLYIADGKPSPPQGCVIIVILDSPAAENQARSVVVRGKVFLDVPTSKSAEFPKAGWLRLPVNADQECAEYLQAAGRVFGVETGRLFDVRLTDEQKAKPASVEGSLSKEDVAEIRRTVFAMARQQILERFSSYSPDRWAELVHQWPGRNVLKINSANGRQAAVYHSPNAGYQMERTGGKWLVVGG